MARPARRKRSERGRGTVSVLAALLQGVPTSNFRNDKEAEAQPRGGWGRNESGGRDQPSCKL